MTAPDIVDVLVVGGDGLLGRTLRESPYLAGLSVHASTRRPDLAGPDRPLLDLLQDDWPTLASAAYGTAILATGISNLRACETDPDGTKRVNVDAVGRLARRLADRGTRVLLISSSQVFDGKSRFPRPSDPVSPINAYGRQKAEAEALVLALPGGSVLRMTKTLSPDMPLLRGWADELSHGRPISPLSDMLLAPVPLDLVCDAIGRMIRRRIAGICQISASDDIAYADLGAALCRHLGAEASLVRPSLRPASFTDGATWRRWSALDTSRTTGELGLVMPDPMAIVRDVVSQVPRP